MVEEPRHGDALLQAGGQHVAPFVLGIPASGALDEVRDGDGGKEGVEVRVCRFFAVHVAQGVRVDDLLAQAPAGEVRALRDVEDVGVRGFAHGAAVNGPEAAEDAEEGGFAAAVGADDEKVGASGDGEGEGGDKDVAIGGDDGDIPEFDDGGFNEGTAVVEDGGVGG